MQRYPENFLLIKLWFSGWLKALLLFCRVETDTDQDEEKIDGSRE